MRGGSIQWGVCLGAILLLAAGRGETPIEIELLPEDIVGVVLRPDGKTPIAELPVRVWNTEKNKTIYRTKTDKDGIFRLPALKASRNIVFVGRVKIDMRILSARKDALMQRHDWVIVMPRGLLMSRMPEMADIIMGIPVLLQPSPPSSSPPPVSP